ncbi:hypothetical protein N7491_009336 [Penicillium cf. griseofulvum]|uniref:Uncharacterized protein n=1 Tax=Penicillium cf. griseofulvum TaxID=2972120 RepID=A0A9W9MFY6_9EURO|nr:hypothetical protein N7472_005071 [Penicillium cf. griseofulvum]KAJ5424120.1 hypothetical protein N7491_009336 [Penicillium cf. griseofulvum]KAJ5442640.1 hypothetical protein N7445_005647 [Penicillium cf. griseofulvum]
MAHSGSGQSSVGNRSIYEAGDQRNVPVSELQERARYAEGLPQSHKNLDSKDNRTIVNKLASQEKKTDTSHHQHNEYDAEAELSKRDPTKPAVTHGNAPSKGAQIDAELKADDEQRMQEKGIKR